jgi:ADP-heptose:LPS heptosyltransferase
VNAPGEHPRTCPATAGGRALLLRRGGLGDFLLALPCAALLRRCGCTRVTVAGDPRWLPLAEHSGEADDVIDATGSAWLRREADPAFWAAFSRVQAIAADDGSLAHMLASYLPAGSWRVVPPRPAVGHAAAWFAQGLGVPEPRVIPPRLRHGIVIHPGSGSPTKNAPLEHWVAIVAGLPAELRAEVTWTAGAAEAALLSNLRALVREGLGGAVWEGPAITALATRLETVAAFAGHDTGPAHLAAWCGAPVVALFGPTDPAHWAPLGRDVRILPLRAPPQRVAAELRAAWERGRAAAAPAAPARTQAQTR